MSQRSVTRAILFLAVGAAAWAGAVDREAVVREMLDRSRLLEDVHFKVPLPLWRRYIEETVAGAAAAPQAPVPLIPEEAVYHLTVAEDGAATLAVRLRLRVFDPRRVTSAPVLSTSRAWQDVRVNGQPTDLLLVGTWLRVVADAAGTYEVAATTSLAAGNTYGGSCELAIPPTVRTLVRLDSPAAWALTAEGAPLSLRGSAERGTHGQLALTARDRLKVAWKPPTALTDRAPRFQLRGAVAWNLDAAVQQVAARLDVAIVGGRADRMVLRLPPAADRVSVTGPDVRETRIEGGTATAYLRGKIAEHTRLDVRYETPHGRGTIQRFGGIEVVGGHWSGGTLVVTNTAGGSEVLVESLSGLRELPLSQVPGDAAALLAGPPAVACAIAARQWSAAVDVMGLGEFALRESIADLAHYELSFRGDGTLVCKATYEVRNRTRQFLRLDLPRGATALLARVNEKTRPLTPVPGAADAWLLPLVRSKASVKGLVTFPVEVVYMCRVGPLERRGETALPLPRIDLPIAYAWCEAYVPDGMRVGRWTGPLRKVEQYSSETAKADLGYGHGIAVEGYKGMARPTAAPEPPPPEEKPKPEPAPKPKPKPEPKEKPTEEGEPSPRRRGLGILGWFGARRGTKRAAAETAPIEDMPVPVTKAPVAMPKSTFEVSPSLLTRNYYRAGKDSYDKNEFANAAKNFEKVLELSPKSNEALNASRLLANIRLTEGKLELKSRAEKAAGAQFQRRQEQVSVKEEQQQVKFLEKGLKAAREGRLSEARAQLQAAGSLGRKLLEQGAGQREQHARLGVIQEKLAEVRKKEAGQAEVLHKEVEKLERAGDYVTALKTAQKLRQFGEADKKAKDRLLSLSEQAARQQSLRREVKQLRHKLHSLNSQVAKLAPKGTAETALEGPAIDAADRGKDRDDEYKSLSQLEDNAERLRNQLGTFQKRLDSLARVPGQPPAKRPPGRPQPTPGGPITGTADTSGFTDLARKYFDPLATTRPPAAGDLALPLGETTMRFRPGKEDEAVRTLSKRIARDPGDTAALIERAQHYLATQQYEEALEDANASMRLTGPNPMANYVRGSVYMRLKKLDDAIHEYQQAAAAQPNHLPTRFWLARSYLMKDQPRKAIEELNATLRINPRFTPARLVLASAHLQQGDSDAALSTLRETLRYDPKNIEARRLLGTAFLHKGENEKAEQSFAEMARQDPAAPRAHQILAGIALSKGHLNKAVEHCVEALDVEPKNVDVHFLLGLAHVRRGRLADARHQFERVLELRGRHPGARMNLAAVHARLGDLRGAEEQYRLCIEEDPTLAEPRLGLARLYGLQRKFGKAENELNQLLKTGVDRAQTHRALADLRRARGEDRRGVTTIGGEELTTPKWEPELREAMASKKVSFDFVETPLEDVLAFLGGLTDVTIVLDREAVRGDVPAITLRATDMPLRQAIDWVTKLAAMKYTLQDDVVFVAKPDRLHDKAVLRMYDVGDLTIDIKDLSGRQQAAAKGKPDDDQETLTGEAVLERIRRTIAPGSWSDDDSKPGDAPGYTISYRNGRIVVVHTPEVNRQIEELLNNYRKVRGPQVEFGGNIAQQRAKGQLGSGIVLLTDGRDVSGAVTGGGKPSGELRRFIWRNYDWQIRQADEAARLPQAAVPRSPDDLFGDLSGKLGFNLGQKVQVSSINLDIPAQAANQLGASFQTGNNGVVFTVVDEAQFRTLVELDSRKNRFGRSVPMNPRGQDTIVGTDALLANAWTANVRFAADRANTIDVNANPISLAHDQYILIDNGTFLTAVRAGEMQHWTERSAPVQLADVPQDIDVPRVGQMVKLEKTLVEPDDELVLRAAYSWKGEGR